MQVSLNTDSSLRRRRDADYVLPSTPAESLLAWVCAVRRERRKQIKNAGLAGLLRDFESEALLRWMRHELTVAYINEYFSWALASCEEHALLALRTLAQHHLTALAQVSERLHSEKSEERRNALLRLNENLAGRLFDSVLMQEIIRNPSRMMRENIRMFGESIWKLLEAFPSEEKTQLLKELKKDFSHHWELEDTPDQLLNNVADQMRDDCETIEQDIQNYIHSRKYIRTRSGLLPYVYMATCLEHLIEDNYPAYAPWRKDALAYYQIIKAVRSRDPNVTEKKVTKQTGILFSHQIKLERDDVRNVRAIDFLGGIDIAHLKPPAKNALLHGLPFVCGISAHTMNIVQAVAYFRENAEMSEALDPKYIVLTYFAHLVDIGAHSIQEASWMVYQLDGPLYLGLQNFWTERQRARAADPQAIEQYRLLTRSDDDKCVDEAKEFLIRNAFESNFIIDYEQLFHAFDEDEETKHLIEKSLRRAWEVTLKESENSGYY